MISRYTVFAPQLIELPAVLQCTCLALLIVALARPQTVDTQTNRSGEGIDIVIVFGHFGFYVGGGYVSRKQVDGR